MRTATRPTKLTPDESNVTSYRGKKLQSLSGFDPLEIKEDLEILLMTNLGVVDRANN